MKRQYHKWFSHPLGRDMELLAFGHAGAKVLVFPTREGRFYDYENWGLVNALRPSIEGGHIRLFCVDGVDSESLYCRAVPPPARAGRHRQYEGYILQEVIPLMLSENGVPHHSDCPRLQYRRLSRNESRASPSSPVLQGRRSQRAL